MRLSKSRLLAYLQCPKRLWLSVHRQELARYSQATRQGFETGHRVGEIARLLYAQGRTTAVAADRALLSAFNEAQGLLFPLDPQAGSKVFFEAAFRHEGVLIRADVLEYNAAGTRLIEVKAGGHVKEEYAPDVAIQKWVINGAGVSLSDICSRAPQHEIRLPGKRRLSWLAGGDTGRRPRQSARSAGGDLGS